MNSLLVNCRITKPNGEVVETFTVEHNDSAERQYLGAACANAFASGWKVGTWPEGAAFE